MAQFDTAVRRQGAYAQQIDAGLRAHMNSIYSYMGIAMLVTGVVAYVFGMDLLAAMQGQSTMLIPVSVLSVLFSSPMVYVIMFSPLAIVFLFGAMVHRMNAGAAQGVFWLFAALMGLSLSTIFVRFTGISIAQTFFATAIAFLGLSLYGYTTKRDLSGMGSFLIMGVIGLIVASLINIFLQSSALQFAVSLLGVLIFAGLTAYDTQRLKSEYVMIAQSGGTAQMLQASAISGALSLYGYTTKRDLSGMGSFLIMGVIGLIVASLINIFLQSSALQFAVSLLGVLIFAGLTAYDTQRLKSEYVMIAQSGGTAQMLQASAISGALSLYLNFLNMFMFLLQFMGAARE
jgi:FtsH-binding integral membrane protein